MRGSWFNFRVDLVGLLSCKDVWSPPKVDNEAGHGVYLAVVWYFKLVGAQSTKNNCRMRKNLPKKKCRVRKRQNSHESWIARVGFWVAICSLDFAVPILLIVFRTFQTITLTFLPAKALHVASARGSRCKDIGFAMRDAGSGRFLPPGARFGVASTRDLTTGTNRSHVDYESGELCITTAISHLKWWDMVTCKRKDIYLSFHLIPGSVSLRKYLQTSGCYWYRQPMVIIVYMKCVHYRFQRLELREDSLIVWFHFCLWTTVVVSLHPP